MPRWVLWVGVRGCVQTTILGQVFCSRPTVSQHPGHFAQVLPGRRRALNSANSELHGATLRHNHAMGAIYTALKARPAPRRRGKYHPPRRQGRRVDRLARGGHATAHTSPTSSDSAAVSTFILFEVKCHTPFRTSRQSLGRGSARCGGAASTSDRIHRHGEYGGAPRHHRPRSRRPR